MSSTNSMNKTVLLSAIGALAVALLSVELLLPTKDNTPVATPEVVTRHHSAVSEQFKDHVGSSLYLTSSPKALDQSTKFPIDALPVTPMHSDWRDYNPEKIQVVIADETTTFSRLSYKTDPNGATWVGRRGLNRLSFVAMRASKNVLYVIVEDGHGTSYSVEVNNTSMTQLTSWDARPTSCSDDHPINPIGSDVSTNTSTVASTVASDVSGATPEPLSVRVLFITDMATFRAEQSDQERLYTKVAAALEASNQERINSGITSFRWDMAGLAIAPESVYVFSDNMGTDIGKLYTEGNPLYTFTQTNLLTHGADQCHLLVTGGGGWGGMANVTWRYGMTRYDQLFYRTMTHEMGHNFGAYHDRKTDGGIGTNQTAYRYGFMFHDTARYWWSTTPIYTGDIMSYASTRMPYYASPSIKYSHSATDDKGVVHEVKDVPMGVAEGNPDAADAARYIGENAERMAGYNSNVPTDYVMMQPSDVQVEGSIAPKLAVMVSTSGTTTYQWYKNGVAINGATSATYLVSAVSTLTNSDSYHCVAVINGKKVMTDSVYATAKAQSTLNAAAKFVNISTRSQVKLAQEIQVAGFVVSGTAAKTVLIRAAGPALTAFGVTDALSDPTITLFDGNGQKVTSNDNWDFDVVNDVANTVKAFAFTKDSKDAAIRVTLQPGAYTVEVSGTNGATGVALVEVYEVDKTNTASRPVNISTRSYVGTGFDNQVAGFVVEGAGYKTLLIRASGPALAPFGISNYLADPVITIYDKDGNKVVSNDNWDATSVDATAKAVKAFDWTAGSKDAALLVVLPSCL